MTRNSMRSYWMTNKKWYKIENNKFVLTPEATPAARRSFAEWNKPQKIGFRRRLRRLKLLFF